MARFCGSCGFQLAAATPTASDAMSAKGREYVDGLTAKLGLERIEGFSLARLFSETFRSHSEADFEERLMSGTARSTPPLSEVSTDWPTPWVFSRMLLAAISLTAVLWFAFQSYDNLKLVPGLIVTGSFAFPLAMTLFFFEINVIRNVSLVLVCRMLFLGGVLSIFVALFLYGATDGLTWWLGASSAGLVEEAAKLAAVLLIVRGELSRRYPFILNGMLFGAAVGAGFAAFESAGYALEAGLLAGREDMVGNIVARGLLSPLGHVVWSAVAAGSLWRVKQGQPFSWEMLGDRRAYAPILLVVGLHFLWNTPFDTPLFFKQLVLGAVAWIVAIALIQSGLRQVAERKSQLAAG